MATELYKAGDSVERFGIRCDMAKVEPNRISAYLENGWKLDPKECYETQEVAKEIPEEVAPPLGTPQPREVKKRGPKPKARP